MSLLPTALPWYQAGTDMLIWCGIQVGLSWVPSHWISRGRGQQGLCDLMWKTYESYEDITTWPFATWIRVSKPTSRSTLAVASMVLRSACRPWWWDWLGACDGKRQETSWVWHPNTLGDAGYTHFFITFSYMINDFMFLLDYYVLCTFNYICKLMIHIQKHWSLAPGSSSCSDSKLLCPRSRNSMICSLRSLAQQWQLASRW